MTPSRPPRCGGGRLPRAPATACSSTRPTSSCATRTAWPRSEEHTSELQSRENLVCRLLLEKKNGRTRSTGAAPPWASQSPVAPASGRRLGGTAVSSPAEACAGHRSSPRPLSSPPSSSSASAPSRSYTLSLHDALPIFHAVGVDGCRALRQQRARRRDRLLPARRARRG